MNLVFAAYRRKLKHDNENIIIVPTPCRR